MLLGVVMTDSLISKHSRAIHAEKELSWTRLTPDRRELAYKYMEVMYQMNRVTYAAEPADTVIDRIFRQNSDYYYYTGTTFEVVIGFKWIKRLRRYRVMNCGFAGDIGLSSVVTLLCEKAITFMREKRVDRVIAIRPRYMESQRIMEVYDLLLHTPLINIRGTHQVAEGTYWWITPPDSQ